MTWVHKCITLHQHTKMISYLKIMARLCVWKATFYSRHQDTYKRAAENALHVSSTLKLFISDVSKDTKLTESTEYS